MASSSSCTVEGDDAQLKALYDTFCSVCSIKDIALAYIKAGHNAEKAGEILCNANKKYTQIPFDSFNCETSFDHSKESSQMRKPKRGSASVGTVSSFLGKTYYRPTSSLNEPSRMTKPLKLNGIERLDSKAVAERNILENITKERSISNTDVEEFLFSMLGDGFKLSMDSIRKVLGHCGYNVKQSMEELLSLSEKTLDVDQQIINQKDEENRVESKKLPQGHLKKSSLLNEEKASLSREVLESLFSIPDRFEEEPKVKRLEWGLNRTRVTGQKPVTKPFEDYDVSPSPTNESTKTDIMKDEDDTYQVLRKATKQRWDTMKLYYEAAVDAFTKGEHKQTSYFLEQGKHYYQLAREADEKSSGLILEKEEPDEKGSELLLDLCAQSINEAIRLLKLHLLSLASIPSFRFLRVAINAESDNTSRGKRRREKVIQLLEKESIGWSEVEGSPGIILIRLDVIDRYNLSFQSDSP